MDIFFLRLSWQWVWKWKWVVKVSLKQLWVVNLVTSELIPLWDALLRQHGGFVGLGVLAENQKEITLHGCDIQISWMWQCRIDWITTNSLSTFNPFLTSDIIFHVTLGTNIIMSLSFQNGWCNNGENVAAPVCIYVCYCIVILHENGHLSSSNTFYSNAAVH